MRRAVAATGFALLALAGGAWAAECEVVLPVETGLSASEIDAAREIHRLELEQDRLLASVRLEIGRATDPARKADLQRRLAEVERRIAAGPQRRCPLLDPPAIAYVHEVVARIEECGTRNFPSLHGRPQYGAARARFAIGMRGELIRSQVVESSGDAPMDAQVLAMIEASAPFGRVPRELRDGDALVFDELFTFAHQESPSPPAKPRHACRLGRG